jgi:hypothetical protein
MPIIQAVMLFLSFFDYLTHQERLNSLRRCFPFFCKHKGDFVFLQLDALFVGVR